MPSYRGPLSLKAPLIRGMLHWPKRHRTLTPTLALALTPTWVEGARALMRLGTLTDTHVVLNRSDTKPNDESLPSFTEVP